MTTSGFIGIVGSISSQSGVALSASGEVWAGTATGLRRVVADPLVPYDASYGTGATYAVKLANGDLWTTAGGYLWRMTTQ